MRIDWPDGWLDEYAKEYCGMCPSPSLSLSPFKYARLDIQGRLRHEVLVSRKRERERAGKKRD